MQLSRSNMGAGIIATLLNLDNLMQVNGRLSTQNLVEHVLELAVWRSICGKVHCFGFRHVAVCCSASFPTVEVWKVSNLSCIAAGPEYIRVGRPSRCAAQLAQGSSICWWRGAFCHQTADEPSDSAAHWPPAAAIYCTVEMPPWPPRLLGGKLSSAAAAPAAAAMAFFGDANMTMGAHTHNTFVCFSFRKSGACGAASFAQTVSP